MPGSAAANMRPQAGQTQPWAGMQPGQGQPGLPQFLQNILSNSPMGGLMNRGPMMPGQPGQPGMPGQAAQPAAGAPQPQLPRPGFQPPWMNGAQQPQQGQQPGMPTRPGMLGGWF